ncbi:MAG: NAD(P)-dependent oxidoreductase, partial [Hoeflea sp.]|uniref:NAD(P)-dependent oxidoreductase n=1 Tax=Hoeflea sp. TaxID=1940281 RepID=UPI00329996DE
MTLSETTDVKAKRLSSADYADNFTDIHPPLTPHEALVEADRCYFCYDAPCMTACPTSIDIPMFIRQIQAGNPVGSAKTIFAENIMGGMCARVCPTETLCEEVCVRETAEGKPVKIGLLQRHATDTFMEREQAHPFTRAAATGKKVAVIGAGPAGLSCAHRLATHGHDVTVYEAREKAGGLNEYGIASYKTTNDFAQDEVEFILQIDGISIENGKALGRDVTLDQLTRDFDAVFLGLGLPGVNALGLEGEDAKGVIDAVDFIAVLRQTDDVSALEIGRRIVVIGGGMTAIDAAIQSKLLGAEEVTIAYRRGQEHMNASLYEQELAQTHGVVIRHWLAPNSLLVADDQVYAITLEKTELDASGKLAGTGQLVTLEADQVFKAIGQTPDAGPLAGIQVELEKGRIRAAADRRTSHPKIWAGRGCIA